MYAKIKKIPGSLGGCEIIDEIASGNMGTVYKGYDPVGDRPVAIKVLRADRLQDKEQAARYRELFNREASTASMLHHPNILEVYASGHESGRDYIIMEMVKHAKTLKDFMYRDELLSVEEVVHFAMQCVYGIEHSHKHGVIHRDIKPANLLVTEDYQIKIADFSIAHITNNDFDMTMSTGFVGSPRYMSPEQMQGDLISEQSDIYSLGVVIYELLTGKHPFEANSFSRLVYKVIHEEPISPSTLRENLPEKLGEYILHALHKDPLQRYQTIEEMATYFSCLFSEQELSIKINERKKAHKLDGIQNLPIFKGFDQAEIKMINEEGLWQRYHKDEPIIKEYDEDDSFYILEQGEVEAIKDGNILGRLFKGDCFGEMVYLSRQPRSATVIARTDVTVMKITSVLISKLSSLSQLRLCREFLNIVIHRLENSDVIEDSALSTKPVDQG